jgi:hypothetical protein
MVAERIELLRFDILESPPFHSIRSDITWRSPKFEGYSDEAQRQQWMRFFQRLQVCTDWRMLCGSAYVQAAPKAEATPLDVDDWIHVDHPRETGEDAEFEARTENIAGDRNTTSEFSLSFAAIPPVPSRSIPHR